MDFGKDSKGESSLSRIIQNLISEGKSVTTEKPTVLFITVCRVIHDTIEGVRSMKISERIASKLIVEFEKVIYRCKLKND